MSSVDEFKSIKECIVVLKLSSISQFSKVAIMGYRNTIKGFKAKYKEELNNVDSRQGLKNQLANKSGQAPKVGNSVKGLLSSDSVKKSALRMFKRQSSSIYGKSP
jgi:hypothetical protein